MIIQYYQISLKWLLQMPNTLHYNLLLAVFGLKGLLPEGQGLFQIQVDGLGSYESVSPVSSWQKTPKLLATMQNIF